VQVDDRNGEENRKVANPASQKSYPTFSSAVIVVVGLSFSA
jgi:hypothetical protein